MNQYEEPKTAVTIALHRCLYLANIINQNEGSHTAFTLALHGGCYKDIIMVRYEGTKTALTIMDRYKGPHTSINIALRAVF
jgi:hypothetical protein